MLSGTRRFNIISYGRCKTMVAIAERSGQLFQIILAMNTNIQIFKI